MRFNLTGTLKQSETYTFGNIHQSGDKWKRSSIILAWTTKTKAFENADAGNDTSVASTLITAWADDFCKLLHGIASYFSIWPAFI